MAKLYSRRIKAGKITIMDVPEYWRADTAAAYLDMYGDELQWT